MICGQDFRKCGASDKIVQRFTSNRRFNYSKLLLAEQLSRRHHSIVTHGVVRMFRLLVLRGFVGIVAVGDRVIVIVLKRRIAVFMCVATCTPVHSPAVSCDIYFSRTLKKPRERDLLWQIITLILLVRAAVDFSKYINRIVRPLTLWLCSLKRLMFYQSFSCLSLSCLSVTYTVRTISLIKRHIVSSCLILHQLSNSGLL